MRIRKSISLWIILGSFIPVYGQPYSTVAVSKDSAGSAPLATYIKDGIGNGIELIKSPLHWKSDQWINFSAAAVITGLLISMDEPISTSISGLDTKIANQFGRGGEIVGSGYVLVGGTLAALGLGLGMQDQRWVHFSLDNLQALAFTGGITLFSKHLFHRERPFRQNGPYLWHGPTKGWEHTSFFSGHSSGAFATATMVFLHSRKKWWVGAIGYTLATGVAISRVQQEQHWISDVALGAITGTAVSKFVYHQQQKNRNKHKTIVIP